HQGFGDGLADCCDKDTHKKRHISFEKAQDEGLALRAPCHPCAQFLGLTLDRQIPRFSVLNLASKHPIADTKLFTFQDPRTPGTHLLQHPRLQSPPLNTNTRPPSRTLYCSVRGSIISSGRPFTLMRPLPRLQCATAVAVFCGKRGRDRGPRELRSPTPTSTPDPSPSASPRPRPPPTPPLGLPSHLASEDLHGLQRPLGRHGGGRRRELLTARRRDRKRKSCSRPSRFSGSAQAPTLAQDQRKPGDGQGVHMASLDHPPADVAFGGPRTTPLPSGALLLPRCPHEDAGEEGGGGSQQIQQGDGGVGDMFEEGSGSPPPRSDSPAYPKIVGKQK
ncbi:hypothetical protein HPG69_018021, partial [Diceros bicornis minor]